MPDERPASGAIAAWRAVSERRPAGGMIRRSTDSPNDYRVARSLITFTCEAAPFSAHAYFLWRIYEIPEGTQTGREFILREKGIPEVGNTRRRGNERFTVVVETPTRLTKEQKDLLRQLDGSVDQSPKRKKFLNNLKDFFG